jgi:DNA-directed RNA polymerase specialized sigma24 family protein
VDRHARADSGQRATALDLQVLHSAVLVGEATTADVVARLALPRIRASLRREWPDAPSAMIEEAVEDAILWYLANPTRYDPGRSGLHTFLHLVARRKMTHAVRSERRRLAHEVPMGLSLPEAAPGYPTPTWRPGADRQDDRANSAHDLTSILALALSDAEREFVLARATGAPTSTLATIIGAGHSPDEQRQAVHRMMARLRQRAKRKPEA